MAGDDAAVPDGSVPGEVFTATFTFAAGQYDDDFHRLDAEIATFARALPGYLGEETWENPATGQISNVYYWGSLAALRQLMQYPTHREAKRRHGEWLAGYHVVIGKVLQHYGDGRIAHPLAAAGKSS